MPNCVYVNQRPVHHEQFRLDDHLVSQERVFSLSKTWLNSKTYLRKGEWLMMEEGMIFPQDLSWFGDEPAIAISEVFYKLCAASQSGTLTEVLHVPSSPRG